MTKGFCNILSVNQHSWFSKTDNKIKNISKWPNKALHPHGQYIHKNLIKDIIHHRNTEENLDKIPHCSCKNNYSLKTDNTKYCQMFRVTENFTHCLWDAKYQSYFWQLCVTIYWSWMYAQYMICISTIEECGKY